MLYQKQIADLEAKLAESEKKNFELIAKLNLKEHRPAFCTLADRDCDALGQVEELKQQLARSRNAIDDLKNKLNKTREELEIANNQILFDNTEFEKLNKQLAEKEKMIEDMKHFKITIGTMENNQVDISSTTYTDQDKIEFAIEKLEKVKEEIGGKIDTFIDSYGDRCIEVVDLEFFIDNQINELKEKK